MKQNVMEKDDDELQSCYVNLFANASDPNYKGNIQRNFVTKLGMGDQ